MGLLLERERDTYREMWGVESYAAWAPGADYVPAFRDMSGATPGQTILDAGCGTGKGALALQKAGYQVRMCDLTVDGLVDAAKTMPFDPACLWHDLKPQLRYLHGGVVDWVYCCDVLEHIPTPFTMLVIANLLRVAAKGVFLSISLRGDDFGAWVGTPLHQTVQSFTDWKTQLQELGTIVECRDLLHTGLYLVRP